MIAICPICLASLALVGAGVTSNGGLMALTARRILKKNKPNQKRRDDTAEKEGEK